MQYEIIMLEMLSRIKKLEEDVEMLKSARSTIEHSSAVIADDASAPIASKRESAVAYKKMTDDMIEMCYLCGKKVSEGESAPELADDIVDATGMNRNSALMYLYAVSGMLNGEIYNSMSNKEYIKTVDKITNNIGQFGTVATATSDKVFFLSPKEVGFSYPTWTDFEAYKEVFDAEGTIYQWFQTNMINGEFWLRTPAPCNDASFFLSRDGGVSTLVCSEEFSVHPAFVIG